MPQALRTMEKNRASLQGIWQEYFDKFDAAEATRTALQDPDRFRIVALFSAFVEHANYHAPDDPVRTRLTYGASVLAPSTAGGHIELYILLISEILDHDAQIANMLLNKVLGLLREHELVAWSRIDTIWLVSDCGPHFRSYESAAHYLYTLVRKLQVKVHILYLGEQHGKGACDRLFGWCNTWVPAYLQQHPVHGIDNLVSAYQCGSANMMQQDPAGAKFLVRIFDPGQVRPSSRFALVCSSLKISRTYSLSARVNRFAASGVTICNNVFSDLVADQALGSWSVEETLAQEPESWRRGFYDKPRSWELEGPKAGDKTDLTRKFATQRPRKTTKLELCPTQNEALRRSYLQRHAI